MALKTARWRTRSHIKESWSSKAIAALEPRCCIISQFSSFRDVLFLMTSVLEIRRFSPGRKSSSRSEPLCRGFIPLPPLWFDQYRSIRSRFWRTANRQMLWREKDMEREEKRGREQKRERAVVAPPVWRAVSVPPRLDVKYKLFVNAGKVMIKEDNKKKWDLLDSLLTVKRLKKIC